MKFGDKLIKLRKKHGLSQEDLAAKLNVSRQSVSKWESNNTYPETDKIVQICNIFNCSMDDLINDKITEIDEVESKEKNNLNIALDSLLDFLTKTINMFSRMKVSSIIKCVFEQLIIVFILWILGNIVSSIIPNVICKTFNFILTNTTYYTVYEIIKGLVLAVWLILSMIVIIHTFKLRYLNYYEEILVEESKKAEPKKVDANKDFKEKVDEKITSSNEPKIVLRDPSKEPYAFLRILSKIIIFIFKLFIAFVGLILIFSLILALIGLVISISLTFYSKIFAGATISMIGIVSAIIIFLILIIYYIINKKIKPEIPALIILGSIILTGIGIGICILGFKNIKVVDYTEKDIKENEINLMYKDNMLVTNFYPHNYEIVIDNTMNLNDIKIIYKTPKHFNIAYNINYDFDMREYYVYLDNSSNKIEQIQEFINDLKNNTIKNYTTEEFKNSMKIYANDETIKKLMSNFSKMYLYDQETTESGYRISNVESRIVEDEGDCSAHYNAQTDTLICPSWCESKKSKVETTRGTITKYHCDLDD